MTPSAPPLLRHHRAERGIVLRRAQLWTPGQAREVTSEREKRASRQECPTCRLVASSSVPCRQERRDREVVPRVAELAGDLELAVDLQVARAPPRPMRLEHGLHPAARAAAFRCHALGLLTRARRPRGTGGRARRSPGCRGPAARGRCARHQREGPAPGVVGDLGRHLGHVLLRQALQHDGAGAPAVRGLAHGRA